MPAYAGMFCFDIFFKSWVKGAIYHTQTQSYNSRTMEKGNNVLIVDDNISLSQLYQIVFERAGYNVHCVNNSYDALTHINNGNPDFIILDLRMPEIDGIQLCELIRQTSIYLPCILFYTADTRKDVESRCIAAGANGYLTKLTSALSLPQYLRSMRVA